jgi:hypothetical protein
LGVSVSSKLFMCFHTIPVQIEIQTWLQGSAGNKETEMCGTCGINERDAYRVLVIKPEGKGPFGSCRCKWEDNIDFVFLSGLWTYLMTNRSHQAPRYEIIRNLLLFHSLYVQTFSINVNILPTYHKQSIVNFISSDETITEENMHIFVYLGVLLCTYAKVYLLVCWQKISCGCLRTGCSGEHVNTGA